MSREELKYEFCMKQFKPFVVVVVLLAAAVVGWTVFRAKKGDKPLLNSSNLMAVATAPPIKPGVRAPHPDWGTCTNCHTYVGGAKTNRARGAGMTVATAPAISPNASPPHPDWGACTNCHTITGGRNKAVKKAASVAAPMGIWLRPLTSATANQLGLAVTDGVLVSGVYSSAPAKKAGLEVGDVITRIDNIDVDTVSDALGIIAVKKPQDTVKLQVIRNGKRRNIFVPISNDPRGQRPPGQPIAIARVRPNTRVAVAATGGSTSSQVAPVFGRAPAFVLYEPTTGQIGAVGNAGLGTLTASALATQQLVSAGVSAVIVGNIGPAALQRLNNAGVRVYTGAFGAINTVLRAYRSGSLVQATSSMLPRQVAPRSTFAAAAGKVAVAATGPTMSSQVARDLATAPYLIVVDADNRQFEAVRTPAGAFVAPDIDVQTAHTIVDHDATAVIAGNISPRTVQSLSTLGVFAFAGVTGRVDQALQLFRAGRLQVTTVPSTTVVAPELAAPRNVGMTL